MTDTTSQEPLRVPIDGTSPPYITVAVSQLDAVRRLLDSHRIGYQIEEEAISLNGSPEVIDINLSRGANAALVQTILDSVH